MRAALVLPDPAFAYRGGLPWEGEAFPVLAEALERLFCRPLPRGAARRLFDSVRLTDAYLQSARHDAVLATSVATALGVGREAVTRQDVERAAGLLERLLDAEGERHLATAYWALTAYGDYTALAHYGRLAEDAFVSGWYHRPWAEYRLTESLRLALELGHVGRVGGEDGREVDVSLTDAGRRARHDLAELLDATGVASDLAGLFAATCWRERRLVWAKAFPSLDRLRQAFADRLRRLPLPPGELLEVGVGLPPVLGTAAFADGERRRWLADPAAGDERASGLQKLPLDRPGQPLPLRPGSLAAVLFHLALPLEEPRGRVAEAFRLLAPGGVLGVLAVTRLELPADEEAFWLVGEGGHPRPAAAIEAVLGEMGFVQFWNTAAFLPFGGDSFVPVLSVGLCLETALRRRLPHRAVLEALRQRRTAPREGRLELRLFLARKPS